MEERKILGTYFYKNCFWGLYFSGRIRFHCQCVFWETVGIRSFFIFYFLYHLLFFITSPFFFYTNGLSVDICLYGWAVYKLFLFSVWPVLSSFFLFYFMFLSSL
ncbi:hypothetical protein DFP73DRAFT_314276 [Morchella snyderi]|nr:hypothetical protein DFP73DRAFT_314276 [Morchella snyderi]